MSMANTRPKSRAGAKRKLTRAEKKEIAAIIQAAKGDGKPHTAQQTIPYMQMYPDGICRVSEKKYSKSIAFEDISYQLAGNDDKTAIFENWCDFLNYFDASVSVQLSFINQGARQEKARAANVVLLHLFFQPAIISRKGVFLPLELFIFPLQLCEVRELGNARRLDCPCRRFG